MMKVSKLALAMVIVTTKVNRSSALPRRHDTPCNHRRWHIDIEGGVNNIPGCSNSFKVPSVWHSNPRVEAKMFYKTYEECCADLFGNGECNIDDRCDDTAYCDGRIKENVSCQLGSHHQEDESPASAPPAIFKDEQCNIWHYNLDTNEGCTNDMNYPVEWTSPTFVHRTFFHSPYICCSKFFKEGDRCTILDVCNSSSRNIKSGTKEEEDGGIQIVEVDYLGAVYGADNVTGKMPVYSA